MILFDQFKVPTMKFGKRFAEFMIPIGLLRFATDLWQNGLGYSWFLGWYSNDSFCFDNVQYFLRKWYVEGFFKNRLLEEIHLEPFYNFTKNCY